MYRYIRSSNTDTDGVAKIMLTNSPGGFKYSHRNVYMLADNEYDAKSLGSNLAQSLGYGKSGEYKVIYPCTEYTPDELVQRLDEYSVNGLTYYESDYQ